MRSQAKTLTNTWTLNREFAIGAFAVSAVYVMCQIMHSPLMKGLF